jgi:hypothetical protein
MENNQFDISQYSQMDVSHKLHLGRKEFYKLLHSMNAKCAREEAYHFFDYLLFQKMFLYQKLYPHLQLRVITQVTTPSSS